MKNLLILLLGVLALTACKTAKRTPNYGGMGEYGFTYDLENSPSPFTDTSYRPLTAQDFSAPTVVTNAHSIR